MTRENHLDSKTADRSLHYSLRLLRRKSVDCGDSLSVEDTTFASEKTMSTSSLIVWTRKGFQGDLDLLPCCQHDAFF